MEPFDDYNDGKKINENLALTRQDLENWYRGGSVLSDSKFIYVDRFVRLLLLKGKLNSVRNKIIKVRENKYKQVLSEMYSYGGIKEENIEKLRNQVCGNTYIMSFPKGSFREIVFLFDSDDDAGISLTALFVRDKSLRRVANYEEIPSNSYCMRGFLVPVFVTPSNYLWGTIKFIRPEYRGDRLLGWADVNFGIELEGFNSIDINWANHILTDLAAPDPFSENSQLFADDEIKGEIHGKTFDSGLINLNCLLEDNEIMSKTINNAKDFIDNNYMGYIF